MQLCFLLSRNLLSINVPLLLRSVVGNLTTYVPLHVSLLCQALYIHLYHNKVQTVQMIDIVISRYYPAVLQIDLSCQMGCVICNWLHTFQRFFSLPVFFNSIAWCILTYKYSCTSLQIIIVTKLYAKFYPNAEKFGIHTCNQQNATYNDLFIKIIISCILLVTCMISISNIARFHDYKIWHCLLFHVMFTKACKRNTEVPLLKNGTLPNSSSFAHSTSSI
jgi:hypothetical protein